MESCDKVEHALRYRAFRQAIQPLLDFKVRIVALAPARHIIGDGIHSAALELTEDQQRIMAEADKMIEYWAQHYKLQTEGENGRS